MIEKSTVKTEAIYNEDKSHRYVLRKIWDNSKPNAAIIMISPSNRADAICTDMTTMYTINNAYRQGFGSIDIVNLYSKLDAEPFESCPENDAKILEISKKADKVILAWGKGQTKRAVLKRIDEMIAILQPYKEKLFEIADNTGSHGLHPLGAAVRPKWNLVPFAAESKEKHEIK